MALPVSQLPQEIWREVRHHKWLALLIFILVCGGILAAGFFWHYKYQSQVIIFVDDSNAIRPLLEQSNDKEPSIDDRVASAKQMLASRELMQKVAEDVNIFGPGAKNLSPIDLENRMDRLRGNLTVLPRDKSYFTIRYTGHDQKRVYLIAQRLGQLFISESDRRKKQESRTAYDFINKQVQAYEQQLEQAQQSLKDFETKNSEGTEAEGNAKIASLQGKIELAKLDLKESQAQKNSLERQLKGMGQTVNQGETEDVFQNRINNLQQQLDSLRLKYRDSYPDIVQIKQQIKELEKQHEAAKANKSADQVTQGKQVINPLYQTLRSQLASTEAKIDSVQTRLKALNVMLNQAQQRMKKIQANKAEYATLTRGMQVNKDIYDDLLKRREKARVSMRLDLDNQGLDYKIQESAQYPLEPVGPKFPLFASAGILVGLLAPFGVAAAFAQVDPRVRDKTEIEEELELPVLTVIPQIRTPFEQSRDRRRTWTVVAVAVVVIIGYISLAVMRFTGVV